MLKCEDAHTMDLHMQVVTTHNTFTILTHNRVGNFLQRAHLRANTRGKPQPFWPRVRG